MNRRKQDPIKLISAIVAIVVLIFGNNLFQQYTGESVIEYLRNKINPNQQEALFNIVSVDTSIYTDEEDLGNLVSTSQNSTRPTIVYCLSNIQYGNPNANRAIYNDFETTIIYDSQELVLQGKNQTDLYSNTFANYGLAEG